MAIPINSLADFENIHLDPYNDYILMSDLDLSGVSFPTPPIFGSFDFNGKTVSNLSGSGPDAVGMFAYVGGVLKGEVHLENFDLTSENDIGGITPYYNYHGNDPVEFINCSFSGTLNSTGGDAGGFFGQAYFSDNDILISDYSCLGSIHGNRVGGFCCLLASSNGTISDIHISGSSVSLEGDSYVGGIAGKIEGYMTVLNCSFTGNIYGNSFVGGLFGSLTLGQTVSNCTFNGNVYQRDSYGYRLGGLFGYAIIAVSMSGCTGYGIIGGSYEGTEIGGLAGHIDGNGTISNCSFIGIVNGTSRVGGFCGAIYGCTILNCFQQADINNVGDSAYLGGFVGIYSGPSITFCTSNGNVTASSDSQLIGGFAGDYSGGIITDCSSTGNIIGGYLTGGFIGKCSVPIISNCTSNGNITGTGSTGGLIGKFENTESEMLYLINNCKHIGDVTGTLNVGGLVGEFVNLQMQKCLNQGKVIGIYVVGGLIGRINGLIQSIIENCYALSTEISGQDSIGGLIGSIESPAIITNLYARAVVFVSTTSPNHGGLIGNTSLPEGTSIVSSYYDSQVSGQIDNDGRGVPKTTPQMKTGFTFVDWDFETIWGIKSTENDGYPFFGVGDPQPDMPTQLCSFSNSYSFAKIS